MLMEVLQITLSDIKSGKNFLGLDHNLLHKTIVLSLNDRSVISLVFDQSEKEWYFVSGDNDLFTGSTSSIIDLINLNKRLFLPRSKKEHMLSKDDICIMHEGNLGRVITSKKDITVLVQCDIDGHRIGKEIGFDTNSRRIWEVLYKEIKIT